MKLTTTSYPISLISVLLAIYLLKNITKWLVGEEGAGGGGCGGGGGGAKAPMSVLSHARAQ